MRKKLSVLLALLLAPAIYAAEGMWMPQQVPQLADELKRMGLQIDPNRFADLTGDPMGAVISLGGCTASFVSPEGLVVTNHHCAFASIQHNSTPERDLITNGFLAATKADELPGSPGSRVFVTTKIEDVTDKVTGKLNAKLADAERARTIERRDRQLIDECEKPGGVRCRVASFFEGAQYLRTTQMEIRDVRLVYAPAEGVGNYGGETDNWMWPRHTGDYSFYRAYVGPDGKPADFSKDNVPYRPAHWLKVSSAGVKPGDLVMVAGYPGRTFRYRTAMEVQNSREFTIPTNIRYATDLSQILHEQGKGKRDVQIRNASRINGFENMLKNYKGTIENMNRGLITKHRLDREAELAKWIAADPERTKKYGSVMNRLAELSREANATRERDLVLNYVYRGSPMLAQALKVYRWSLEKTKKDLDRAEGYRDRDVPAMMSASTRVQRTFDVSSDRAGLRYMLEEAGRLPSDQRLIAVDQAVAQYGIDGFLDKLYAETKISDGDERKKMYGESKAQLEARNDSMVGFAAALLQQSLADEEKDKRYAGASTRVRPLYLEALREMSGGLLSPDANSTLRISFGVVKGYEPRDAVAYEPQTTLSGVVSKHTGEGEFDAPDALLEAARAGRTKGYEAPHLADVPVNFLSTNYTTGGNSGSPTLNANGELVGLLFDGNFEALGSDYLVDPEVTRSIHADMVYVLWIMDAVDRAHHVMREMGVEPKY
ncbi:MAG: S46 family peptidase [Thermoanaerobaculia bacterium]